MEAIQRPFLDESDLSLMSALATRLSGDHLHVADLPYRLSSWALDHSENTQLWFNEGGQLIAWAALQAPFWTMDITCHPGEDSKLYPEILSWAGERARAALDTEYGRPSWYVMVFASQKARIRDLERAGFQCQSDVGEDSWSKVLLKRSGQDPVKVYNPPPGYVVRPLAGVAEVPAYVELHQSVFESKNMTAGWRLRTLRQPAYNPELDLVVQSSEGRLAAFCICWLDKGPENTLIGQVEPLGCHKDFRRYALGRVALSEGLRRLQSFGVESILVETDLYRSTALGLYESFDFKVAKEVLVYRKDY